MQELDNKRSRTYSEKEDCAACCDQLIQTDRQHVLQQVLIRFRKKTIGQRQTAETQPKNIYTKTRTHLGTG